MKALRLLIAAVSFTAWIILIPTTSICKVEYDHQKDVVYGDKDGMALVMDVFTPKNKLNGAGVIRIMGEGFYSRPNWSHKAGSLYIIKSLLEAGYVVFAAAHSSQPKYTVDEMLWDIPRAIRFIRHHATRFGSSE